MRHGKWWLLVLALSTVSLVACGDDDSSGDADSGTDAGGTGGNGGTGGTGGSDASVPQPVPCGDTECQPPEDPTGGLGDMLGGGGIPIPGFEVPTPTACCYEESSSTCGIAPNATAACEMFAEEDNRCPDIDLGALGALLGGAGGGFGCCTPEGQCGVDGAAFGNGCVENAAAAEMLGLLSGFIMVPDPQPCDGSADGGDDDASTN